MGNDATCSFRYEDYVHRYWDSKLGSNVSEVFTACGVKCRKKLPDLRDSDLRSIFSLVSCPYGSLPKEPIESCPVRINSTMRRRDLVLA